MSQDFEKQSRALLEESTQRLDGRTLSQLTQARHAALGTLHRPGRPRWTWFLPVGAAAAAAVLVVVMRPIHPEVDEVTMAQGAGPEDIEMLNDTDAPDFIADGEDLEFYEWAAGELET